MRRGEKRRAAAVFADDARHGVRVARQPIFDQISRVQAYELLYRPGTGDVSDTSGAAATARVDGNTGAVHSAASESLNVAETVAAAA